METRVKALPELLASQLAEDEEVDSFSGKSATAVGENYGSTMLALDIVIRKKGGQKTDRRLHTFCKMLPDDPQRRAIFSVDVTFVKELEMYTLAVPAMEQLQRDCGVPDRDLVSHLVPRCYGGRTSLVGDAVDDDAVILLEDMRKRGFTIGNRNTGLDLEHAKLLLEKLAVFHALPVALRIKRPQVYQNTVMRACKAFAMGGDQGETMIRELDDFKRCILVHVDKSPKASRYHDAVGDLITATGAGPTEKQPPVREPFATIVHNDIWTNNMLFRKDADGKPLEVALIDFQVTRLNSPFKDLLFFIFTSVNPEVTADHFDDLVKTHHSSFCRCLEQVGVDTTPFSLEAAWNDMNAVAYSEVFHILHMLRFINADPGMLRAFPETFPFLDELGGKDCTAKTEFTILQFAKRGWLNPMGP